MTAIYLLIAVGAIMVAANLALNLVAEKFYVPLAIIFAIGVAAIGLGFGLDLEHLGLATNTIVPGLVWAAIAVGVVAVIFFLAALIRPARVLFADERATSAPGRQIARRMLIDVPLGTVLLEETVFRGVLYGMLWQSFNQVVAIVGTSVLFGLWHVLPAIPSHESHEAVRKAVGTSIWGKLAAIALTVLGTAAAGIGFALTRWWTGSVFPAIGLHWALNGLGLFAAWALARWTHARKAARTLEDHVEAELVEHGEDG